jgi:hypothetical protein
MNTVSVKTFTANFTLGLKVGYTDKLNSLDEVREALTESQQQIKAQTGIGLSAKLTVCEIVFLGQSEPSVEISLLQYPKFPADEKLLKQAILQLASLMMEKLQQNRTVIVFQDETIMLEKGEEIDPAIIL